MGGRGMRLVTVVLLAIGVAPPTLALHGRHLVDRLPRRSWFEDCCISFFPLCYDWNDARYTDLSPASHREVWLLDAAAVPEAVLDDDQELQVDILLEATTLGGSREASGLRAGGRGLVFAWTRLIRGANNVFRGVFGISFRRVVRRVALRLRGATGCGDKRCWDCFEQSAKDTYIFVNRCHKAFEGSDQQQLNPHSAVKWCGCVRCVENSRRAAVDQLFPPFEDSLRGLRQ